MGVLDKLALVAFIWVLDQIHTLAETIPIELELLEN